MVKVIILKKKEVLVKLFCYFVKTKEIKHFSVLLFNDSLHKFNAAIKGREGAAIECRVFR